MPNPFDQFDAQPAGNPFDQFDDYANMSWSEAARRGIKRVPGEAVDIAKGVAGLGVPGGGGKAAWGAIKVPLGAVQLGAEWLTGKEIPEVDNEQQSARDFGNYVGGYFSSAGLKKKIAEQPLATALDVATIATPLKGGGAAKAAAPKIATTAELKAGGGAALNVARDSGVYFKSDFVQPLRDTLVGIAETGGFRPGRKGTAELADIMQDVDAMSSRPWGFKDIRELEQDLNDAWLGARKAGRETVAGIAGRQRQAVRQFMAEVEKGATDGIYATGDLSAAEAARLHSEGLKIYQDAKRAGGAERLKALAENDRSQFQLSGVMNGIRKQARGILRAHAQGKPTGYTAQDLETLKVLRDGQLTDWALAQARRYAGPVGTMIGAQLGGTIGAGIAYGIGRGVSAASDRIAMTRLNRFIETIQAEGSARLEGLLGEAADKHLMGIPQVRAAKANWVKRIGTTGVNAAGKSLALVIAQQVGNPALATRIEAELNKLVEGLATQPAEPSQEQETETPQGR